MENKVRVLEFRTNEGKIIFSIHVYEREISFENKPSKRPNNTPPSKKGKSEKDHNHEGGNNNNLISQAQKKYLFRLLAKKGIEKEAAHNHLKEYFQVESLSEVTKHEASRMIEYMLKEQEEGAKDD